MPYLAAIVILGALLLWREHAMQQERREWTRERGVLLNRIKPETAQPVDREPVEDLPPSPALDDDRAWWEMKGVEMT